MTAPFRIIFGQPVAPDPVRLADLMAQVSASGWLSNGGPLIQELESKIQPWFGTNARARLVSSGTVALMMALRAGNLPEGAEVITSPLSFAATVQAITWCGFRPVFADVDPDSLTLCPRAVRAAITPRTAAILPVHFLGLPCQTGALAELARDYGLWLAYDAAHVFGTTIDGTPIGAFGDASAFSLHATKLMHCGEGGAVVIPHSSGIDMARMRNFGLEGGRMRGMGLNAKLPETSAAMGLAVLDRLDAEIAGRRRLRADYDTALTGIAGVRPHQAPAGTSQSLIYYPLRLRPDHRAAAVRALADHRILARDYFPLLCGAGTYLPDAVIHSTRPRPLAPDLAPEVMCLPFHAGVTPRDAALIGDIIKKAITI